MKTILSGLFLIFASFVMYQASAQFLYDAGLPKNREGYATVGRLGLFFSGHLMTVALFMVGRGK